MWSFAILLWELVTREVPFADLSNMEIGMKVSRTSPRWAAKACRRDLVKNIKNKTFTNHFNRFCNICLDIWQHLLFLWFGLQVALEGLRPTIPPGISPHICKLMKICMNEDPAKRPKFDMIVPILEKMQDKWKTTSASPYRTEELLDIFPQISLWYGGVVLTSIALNSLLYRCIQRHCSFCFWDESSSSHFFLYCFSFFECDIKFLLVSASLSLIRWYLLDRGFSSSKL